MSGQEGPWLFLYRTHDPEGITGEIVHDEGRRDMLLADQNTCIPLSRVALLERVAEACVFTDSAGGYCRLCESTWQFIDDDPKEWHEDDCPLAAQRGEGGGDG